jgi:hypothetical protein
MPNGIPLPLPQTSAAPFAAVAAELKALFPLATLLQGS